jgi:hypothetical protein
MKSKKWRGKRKQSAQIKVDWKALEIVHPDAAGIDVGGSEHWVAVNPERDPEPVRGNNEHIRGQVVAGYRYRIASQSLWDLARRRPFARQAVLGPADAPPVADLASTRTVGSVTCALVWVAEQLDLIQLIDQGCGLRKPAAGLTMGEMVLAVAV